MRTKLRTKIQDQLDYRLPALWDCWGFAGQRKRLGQEVVVNPVEYAAACLEWIQHHSIHVGPQGQSLSQWARGKRRSAAGKPGGAWINRQTIYAMMVRMTTAWDHDGNGKLHSKRYAELGTFFKSILLLPLLKKMGITTVYLLPVTKISHLNRKGDLGCPYSAKNFFEIDAAQHDPLLSLHSALWKGFQVAGSKQRAAGLTDEFALFVECAHRLGMRIMLDIAPRTTARDCDWILDHPDWFYWIDRRFEKNWHSPALPGITYHNPIPGRLGEIYSVPAVREHLAKFRFAPNVTHPREWARFSQKARAHPPANLLADIGRQFGVVTAPAFSDVINDQQPPWSDVTYLRMYKDHGAEAQALLDKPHKQPPYVLFDVIKSNLFPGNRPNRELWHVLADIIPFYQHFGIDGARVDMAHALPGALERMILDRPRRRDPDFCFLAEDLSYDHTVGQRKAGYNVVLGSSWYHQPRASQGNMHRMLADLPGLKLPILAAAETPDTPRAAVRTGGERFSRQAVVVNMFLPNTVPTINSGMEVYERQPMNLGLEVGKPGRFALSPNDPQFAKLAFFDAYALHWKNRGAAEMIDLIARASALRQEHLAAIFSKKAWFIPHLTKHARRILATGFRLRGSYKALMMLANVDFDRAYRTTLAGLPLSHSPEVLLELVASPAPKLSATGVRIELPPGDVKLIRI